MKKLVLLMICTILILNSNFGFAQSEKNLVNDEVESITKEFKVYGNCGMCETKIEKATKLQKGVEKADWNRETNIMTVTYNEEVVKLEQIHQAIAKVGYDTDKVKADDNDYKKLPGCCQYERKSE